MADVMRGSAVAVAVELEPQILVDEDLGRVAIIGIERRQGRRAWGWKRSRGVCRVSRWRRWCATSSSHWRT